MGNPLDSYFGSQKPLAPTSTNPLDSLFGGSSPSVAPQPAPAVPAQGNQALQQLLEDPSVDEAVKAEIRQFLATQGVNPVEKQGAFEEGVRSFASSMVAPFTGISKTVDFLLPGEGSSRVTQGLESLQGALGPTDTEDPNNIARAVGGFAGYLLPSAGVYKVLGKVVGALGGMAAKAAPTLAENAVGRVAAVAARVGKVNPGLGIATMAAPKEIATSLLQTALQSPSDFTTPVGLAFLGGGTAFGLATGGYAKASAYMKAIREAKSTDDVDRLFQAFANDMGTPEARAAQAVQEAGLLPEKQPLLGEQVMTGETGIRKGTPASGNLPIPRYATAHEQGLLFPDLGPPKTIFPEFGPQGELFPEVAFAAQKKKIDLEGKAAPSQGDAPKDPLKAATGKPSPTGPRTASKMAAIKPKPGQSVWEKKILEEVARPTDGRRPLPMTNQLWSELVDRAKSPVSEFHRRFINAKAPLRQVDTHTYNMAALSSGASSSLEAFFRGTPFRFTQDGGVQLLPNIRNLESILKDVGEENIDSFTATLVARRRALDANYPVSPSQKVVAEAQWASASPQMKKLTDDFINWQQAVRQLAEDEGLLTQGTAKLWDAVNNNYVYMRKVFGEGGALAENVPKSLHIRPVKDRYLRLRGGGGMVWDPIISEIDRTERVIYGVYFNRAARALAEAVQTDPERLAQLGVREVKNATSLTDPQFINQVRDLRSASKAAGIELTEGEAIESVLQFSHRARKSQGNTIKVWIPGQKGGDRIRQFEIPKEFAEAYNTMRPRELGLLTQLFGLPARGLRGGIVYNPAFQFFNAIRDSFDAALQSQYGFRLGIDSFKGWLNVVTKSDFYQEWQAGGGVPGMTTTLSGSKAGDALLPTSSIVRKAWEGYKHFIRTFEEAARVGEYVKGRQAGATVLDAVLASKRVTVDFTQMGLNMQALSYMTAFLNPGLQGVARMGAALKEKPGRVLLAGAAGITLPTVLLYAANYRDEEIQELRKSEPGARYWYTRLPTGDILKIPKPFAWGQIFGTAMEATLDKLLKNDPKAFGDWAGALGEEISFNVLPTALQGYISLKSNRDQFSGIPIVPEATTGFDPFLQKSAGTTRLTQWLTQLPGLRQTLSTVGLDSPARFEFVVRQFGGTLGTDLVKSLDWVARPADPRQPASPVAADWPIVGRLLARYPSTGVASVRQFYDEATSLAPRVATMNELAEKGRAEELQAYVEQYREDIALAQVYAETRKELSEMRLGIELINQLPTDVMLPGRKRELTDEITRSMIEMATRVNAAVDQARQQSREALPAPSGSGSPQSSQGSGVPQPTR